MADESNADIAVVEDSIQSAGGGQEYGRAGQAAMKIISVVAEDLRTQFGRRVRELRRGLNLSQEEIAERAGLHRNYIGGVERGERNVALLNIGRLARALGVSLSELFAGMGTTQRRRP